MAESTKAHCPRCNGERNCAIHGALNVPWEWNDDRNAVNGENDHKLLRCLGCEMVFYQLTSWDSEDWDGDYTPTGEFELKPVVRVETHPAPERKSARPDWAWTLSEIDPPLAAIMDEIYRAREAGGVILPAVGLRTAFDRVTGFLKIDPALTFEEKLKLVRASYVGEDEAAVLQVVIEAGNAAAHRGWVPAAAEFEKLLTVLEHFIHRAVVTRKAALDVARSIPPRPARKQKGTAD